MTPTSDFIAFFLHKISILGVEIYIHITDFFAKITSNIYFEAKMFENNSK